MHLINIRILEIKCEYMGTFQTVFFKMLKNINVFEILVFNERKYAH